MKTELTFRFVKYTSSDNVLNRNKAFHILNTRNDEQYTEFLMAYGSEKTRYENMKTRRVRIESKTNMATPGESLFSAPVLLTENDIPGASLQGRKPAEMKKADLLFWLRCRGDSCKGMSVKAQLVKRYVSVKFLMLLY